MMPNTDPSDPLREMLTDTAAHLPATAAQAARDYRARRAQRRRRLAQGAFLALVCVGVWQAVKWNQSRPNGGGLVQNDVQQSAGVALENFVLMQTVEEAASKSLPPPLGATPEQRELLEMARGLPLLLVMDAPGKPARVVVVER